MGCQAAFDEAGAVIFGAPFDSTASYRPGSRFGPAAMRNESYGLETYSPYLDRDLSEISVCDAGDLELPFGDPRPALRLIYERSREILSAEKIPVMLGGEHLVTLAAVGAAAEKYPGLAVIHFDAHADLREGYLGEKLSHATVMRRCYDLLGGGRIYQFGVRSGDGEEFAFARTGAVSMTRFDFRGLHDTVEKLRRAGIPVYLTVDLDVLDPGVFPGTGTPEPGGVTFEQLRLAVGEACGAKIVGADLVELAPTLNGSGVSTAVANKILRELLLGIL